MKSIVAASFATLGLALAFPSIAQQTTPSRSGEPGLRMPYESGFWSHAGLSFGRSEFKGDCFGGGCDDTDRAWRLFGGGRFNNTFGAEVGLLHFGEFDRAGGKTKAKGLDLALTAGAPIGANSSVFGKLGVAYARTDVGGTAPGLQTGKENGWGPRVGIGAQIGLTQNWALRADWDRYRLKFPGTKDNVDTLTVGAQYTFR